MLCSGRHPRGFTTRNPASGVWLPKTESDAAPPLRTSAVRPEDVRRCSRKQKWMSFHRACFPFFYAMRWAKLKRKQSGGDGCGARPSGEILSCTTPSKPDLLTVRGSNSPGALVRSTSCRHEQCQRDVSLPKSQGTADNTQERNVWWSESEQLPTQGDWIELDRSKEGSMSGSYGRAENAEKTEAASLTCQPRRRVFTAVLKSPSDLPLTQKNKPNSERHYHTASSNQSSSPISPMREDLSPEKRCQISLAVEALRGDALSCAGAHANPPCKSSSECSSPQRWHDVLLETDDGCFVEERQTARHNAKGSESKSPSINEACAEAHGDTEYAREAVMGECSLRTPTSIFPPPGAADGSGSPCSKPRDLFCSYLYKMESETAMVSSTKAQANTAASGERGAGTLCVYVRATRESRKGAAKRDLRLSARHKASNSLLILQVVGTSEVEDRRALPVPERLTAQGRQLRTGRIRKDERHRRLTSISASGEEQRRGHNREMKRIPAQKPSGKAPMHSRHRIMRRYRRRVSASQCVSAQAEVFMALAESANDLSRLTYRRRHPDARKCNFPHPETPSDSVDQRGPSLLGASSASRLSQSPVQPGSQTNSVRASEIVLYQGKLSLRPPVSVGLSRLEYSPLHKSIMEARVRNEFSCDSSDTPLSPSFRVFSLPEDTIGSEEGSAQKPLLCQDTLSVIPAMTAEVGRVPPCCVQVVPSPHPIPSDDSLGGCASEAVYSDKVQTEDNPPHSIRIRHRRTDSGASVDVAAVGSSLGSGEIRQGNAVIAFHCGSASAEAGDLSTEGHDAFRGESKRRKLLLSTRSCPTTVHPEVPALCPQRNALSSGLVDRGMRGDPLHRTIPADARFTSTCPFSMISPQREAGTLGQTRLRGTDDPSSALSKLTHRRSASCQVLEANADERQSEKPGEDPSTDGRCSPVTEEKTDECLTHTDILASIIGEGVAGVLERGAMTLHKFLGETLSENWGTEIPRLSCRSERSIEAARDSLLRGTQKRKRPHADTSCPSVFDWIDDEWSVCSVLTTRDKAWRSKVGAWAFCNREDEDSGEESQTVIDCCQRVRTDDIMQPERHRLQTPTRTPRPQSGSSAEMEAMPPRISQKLSHTPVLAMASASSGSSASSCVSGNPTTCFSSCWGTSSLFLPSCRLPHHTRMLAGKSVLSFKLASGPSLPLSSSCGIAFEKSAYPCGWGSPAPAGFRKDLARVPRTLPLRASPPVYASVSDLSRLRKTEGSSKTDRAVNSKHASISHYGHLLVPDKTRPLSSTSAAGGPLSRLIMVRSIPPWRGSKASLSTNCSSEAGRPNPASKPKLPVQEWHSFFRDAAPRCPEGQTGSPVCTVSSASMKSPHSCSVSSTISGFSSFTSSPSSHCSSASFISHDGVSPRVVPPAGIHSWPSETAGIDHRQPQSLHVRMRPHAQYSSTFFEHGSQWRGASRPPWVKPIHAQSRSSGAVLRPCFDRVRSTFRRPGDQTALHLSCCPRFLPQLSAREQQKHPFLPEFSRRSVPVNVETSAAHIAGTRGRRTIPIVRIDCRASPPGVVSRVQPGMHRGASRKDILSPYSASILVDTNIEPL